MEIVIDDLSGSEIAAFLEAHLRDIAAVCPAESDHTLDVSELRQPDVTFWVVREQGKLVGCGALKEVDREHGEVKSMRTAPHHRGAGIGARLLQRIIAAASSRGYRRLSLETGSHPFFAPARRLYMKYGFQPCPPFEEYHEDPNSVFMTLEVHGR